MLVSFLKRLWRAGKGGGTNNPEFVPVEASPEEKQILRRTEGFTMTTRERLWASMSAVKYVALNHVPGAVVECGIWRGGSTMAMIEVLLMLGVRDREVFLFDTFSGMTPASDFDTDSLGVPAKAHLESTPRVTGNNVWCIAGIDDVRANVDSTGYPADLVRLVQGDVLETLEIEANLPAAIAVLRLDTDWYESTKKELEVLFPRLVRGGVCIVDDYGHWSGARKAVNDYLASYGLFPLLAVSDYSGRLFIKS
jgi:O-methyltransferase